ncbi:MAG: response regulator [Thermodesulfobacteria bacterium]|nr:response regulator [Thermodesulfobacteriota bacterium]
MPAEKDLKFEERALWEAFLGSFQGFLTVVGPDDIVLFANEALIKRTGFDPVGGICYEVFHNRKSPCPHCPREEVIEKKKIVSWERVSPKDSRWYNVVNCPITLPDGRLGMFSLAIDVHEKKMAQEVAERHRRFLEAIWNRAPFLLIGINPLSGEIVFVNKAFEETLKYRQEEVIGRRIVDLFPPEERESVIKCCREVCLEGEKEAAEFWWQTKDGKRRLLQSTCFLVEINEGQKLVFNISRDITQERRLQEQLLQAQKMEAVGRLAGGLAHDFNNLLTSLRNYLELIQRHRHDPDKINEVLKNINLVLERTGDITQKLLTFSGRRPQQNEVIDLSRFCTEMKTFWQRLLGEHIELSIEIEEEPVYIFTDETHLQQIIMNLIVNAKDAMPRGGKLHLSVRTKEIEGEELDPPELKPGRYAVLSISDTGPGIPEEALPHIFEPFFTTKPAGQGTGLGLAIVYSLVRQYGGHISVYTERGRGTTFRIYWPLTELTPREKTAPKEDQALLHQGGGTILVVEDDALVREPIVELLREAGYQVFEAENGLEALEILSRQKVDLIISDLVMPKMDGEELINQVKERYPEVKIIISSGYPEGSVPANGKFKGVTFVSKPYTFSDLLKEVHSLLSS